MTLKTMAWERVILHVDEMNTSRLSYKLDMTYSHLTKIIKDMHEKGWININKKGRVNIISLTEKGREIQKACFVIQAELKQKLFVR